MSRELTIPFKGLKNEVHLFDFQLDEKFFSGFENSLIDKGDINLHLEFDKSNEPYVLNFQFEGTFDTVCDKCLADIQAGIQGEFTVYVEFDERESEQSEVEDEEVIYLSRDDDEIDLTKIVYDYISLNVPMIKSCEKPFEMDICDKKVAEYIQNNRKPETEEGEKTDPRWDALKGLLKK